MCLRARAVLNAIRPSDKESFTLNVAALKFPLHVYSVFALRTSNEGLLSSGSSEKEWGFSQVCCYHPSWNRCGEPRQWSSRQVSFLSAEVSLS
jgi:hypothetical protein